MARHDTRVIGYVAFFSATDLLCTDTEACVVSGSSEAMDQYLAELGRRTADVSVRKTRFVDILNGLQLGGAYAFDSGSYGRFYPLAREAGLDVRPADFDSQHGRRFFTVRLDVR